MTLASPYATIVNKAPLSEPKDCLTTVGVVLIGRNEGDRLVRCLTSIVGQAGAVVYVDSGSSDGSCAAARSLGIEVVELDMSQPFSAARARNEGFDWLIQQHPNVDYVQFVDGDCEVVAGWLAAATKVLMADEQVFAVCGWRRERSPEASVFNRICDVEWHWGETGEIGSFGGDVMIRADKLQEIGGYNNRLIAGEDEEVGLRLRQAGGKLIRLDRDATIHDAAMTELHQWWRRAQRCGYAYGLVSSIHGGSPERKFVKEVRSTWLWGAIVPLLAIGLLIPSQGLSLLLLLRYPLAIARWIFQTHKRGFSWADSVPWAISGTMSVFPGVVGLLQFYRKQWLNSDHVLIEYKGAEPSA